MTTLETRAETEHGATTGTSRWQMLVGAMGLVVAVWVGGDLYDIVTSGGTGPGGARSPGVNAPAGQPSPPGGPGGDGGHRPPAGGHGGQQR